MSSVVRKPPSYRHHKPTEQAVVTLNGKDFYLGKYGTPESREAYNRKIAEWLASGRQTMPTSAPGESITVTEVAAAYWIHAEAYYKKPDGTPSSEVPLYKRLLGLLDSMYGSTPASTFGPLALKAVRQAMIDKGWRRKSINKQVDRIRRVFKWASAQEIIPASVHHALTTVEGLRFGRGGAKESEPVKPAPEAMIEAVKPFLSRQVVALIELQLLTGAREGELLKLRAVDLDTTTDTETDPTKRVWFLRPAEHKTAHHQHDRIIRFGPRAQEVIKPFLADRAVDAYLFSPNEAEADRRAKMRAQRKTKVQPSQVRRAEASARRTRATKPGEFYTPDSYRRAIERACEVAFPPPDHLAQRDDENREQYRARLASQEKAELKAWRKAHRWNPHRLRHNAATDIRRSHDLEVAGTVLGHKSLDVTQMYAEADQAKATEAIRRIG